MKNLITITIVLIGMMYIATGCSDTPVTPQAKSNMYIVSVTAPSGEVTYDRATLNEEDFLLLLSMLKHDYENNDFLGSEMYFAFTNITMLQAVPFVVCEGGFWRTCEDSAGYMPGFIDPTVWCLDYEVTR